MPLESASYINQLIPSNPTSTDPVRQGDDHIRLVKQVLRSTFPNLTGPVSATQEEINALSATGGNYVPTGGIIMWSGAIASIPSGWAICDGTNGTPDLRNRFIVGAGQDYSVGANGGSNAVGLAEVHLPPHTHSFSGTTGGHSNDHSHFINLNTNASGDHSHSYSVWFQASNSGGGRAAVRPEVYSGLSQYPTAPAGNHAHNVQGNTGGTSSNHTHDFSGTTGSLGSGEAHENRPPYYALAYIMKT